MDLDQVFVQKKDDVISSSVDDDLVILDTDKGKYYGTSIVGRRIWELLSEPTSGNEICRQLVQEFDVKPEVCRLQTSDFIQKLIDEKLVVASYVSTGNG